MKSEKPRDGHKDGGHPQGVGRAPQPCAPSPRDPPDLIFLPIYSQISINHQRHPRKDFFTAATFCTCRDLFRHPAGGDSITGGFYINSIAFPIKRVQFTSDIRVHSQQVDVFFSLFDSQYHVLLNVLGDLFDVILFCGVFAEIR